MAEVVPNFDSLDYGEQDSLSIDNLSTSHTVGAGTGIMVVIFAGVDDADVTVANWDGAPMTLLDATYHNLIGARRLNVYYVIAPTGTHNVDFTMEANSRFGVTIIDFSGVNQASPITLEFTATVATAGHVETGTTDPDKITASFIVDAMVVGGGSTGYTFTAPPFEDGGDNDQIPLDGRVDGQRNGDPASSAVGVSYKAGIEGSQIETHMGCEHNIYSASRNWGYVVFSLNPGDGEEENEFVAVTDEHIQVPGRVRSM